MRHKDKKKLARRLREQMARNTVIYFRNQGHSEENLKRFHAEAMNSPIFNNPIWDRYKAKIEERVDQTIANQQMMAEKRRERLKHEKPN